LESKRACDAIVPATGSQSSDSEALLPALTSLRFVAALLVFLFHFPPEGRVWQVVAGEGHVGVNIFFVLSGFLITLRYGERLARGDVGLREYFVRRAARILPLYYTVFLLSQLAVGEGIAVAGRIPEWTLTQAFFGESVHDLVVPTSWSLTVEECFYVVAPVLFLVLAATQRRWPRSPFVTAAVLLVGVVLGLTGLGAVVYVVLDGSGPGFLRSAREIASHTLFGRFYDFGVGVLAALIWRSPAARGSLPRRPMAALAGTLASTALIVAAQAGMHRAGGIEGPRWADVWGWGLVLGPAAAALILLLAVPTNPVARILSWEPFLYLGKISYALYLIQLTAIGKGLLYRVIPRQEGALALVLLYLGMTALSVLLYELVEEPARRLVLRIAGLQKQARARPPSRMTRLSAATALALVVMGQAAWSSWSSLERALGPVTLAELTSVGVAPDDMLRVPAAAIESGRDVLLVGFPRRWREGWGDDLRAPHGLHVFLESSPVAFARRDPGVTPAAFYRGPRAEYLALRVQGHPNDVIVIRDSPRLVAAIHLERLLATPEATGLMAALLAAGLSLALFAGRGTAAVPAAVAMCLGAAIWWSLGIHDLKMAPIIIAMECVLAVGLLIRPRWSRAGTAHS
jgi:peptidoglycan/LPS O-acetylase OafA/YrhL